MRYQELFEAYYMNLTIRTLRMDRRSVKIVVRDLAEGRWSMTKGPVLVFGTEFDQYQLDDGYHRVLEAILLGKTKIRGKYQDKIHLRHGVTPPGREWVFNPASPHFGLEELFKPDDIEQLVRLAKEKNGIVTEDAVPGDRETARDRLLQVATAQHGGTATDTLKAKIDSLSDAEVDRYLWTYQAKANPLDNENFRRWFGASKVVDAQGRPLVLHHGTDQEFDAFEPRKGLRGDGGIFEVEVESPFKFFAADPAYAHEVASAKAGIDGRVLRVYLRMEHPLDLTTRQGLVQAHQIFGVMARDPDVRAAQEEAEDAAQQLQDALDDGPNGPYTKYVRYDANGKVVGARTNMAPGFTEVHVTAAEAEQEYRAWVAGLEKDLRVAQAQVAKIVATKKQPPSVWDYFDQPGSDEKLRQAGFDGVIFRENGGEKTYAVLDSAQIKAVDNRGTFNPADPRIREGRRPS